MRVSTILPLALSVTLAAIICAHPARASSPDAWEEFHAAVETACRQAAADWSASLEEFTVTVVPYGSEAYGVALLEGRSSYDGQWIGRVCLYDKVTHEVELTGEYPAR